MLVYQRVTQMNPNDVSGFFWLKDVRPKGRILLLQTCVAAPINLVQARNALHVSMSRLGETKHAEYLHRPNSKPPHLKRSNTEPRVLGGCCIIGRDLNDNE
jgi:hypothetical protein